VRNKKGEEKHLEACRRQEKVVKLLLMGSKEGKDRPREKKGITTNGNVCGWEKKKKTI